MRLDIHIFWTEKLWKEMSMTLCLLYSLTYVIFRAFWRRVRPSQTSYPSVSRFSKWRLVGHAWRTLWNSPHSYLWWVGRLENQVFQIRKIERKERKITLHSCYYFDFLSSSPISIFFSLQFGPYEKPEMVIKAVCSLMVNLTDWAERGWGEFWVSVKYQTGVGTFLRPKGSRSWDMFFFIE